MRRIRDGDSATVPEAVRQILRNELITDERDVTRIMSEVGTILQQRQQYAAEDAVWGDIRHEEMLRGAEQAYWQRGGDPKD